MVADHGGMNTAIEHPEWGRTTPVEEVPLCFSGEFARAVGRMLVSFAREAGSSAATSEGRRKPAL